MPLSRSSIAAGRLRNAVAIAFSSFHRARNPCGLCDGGCRAISPVKHTRWRQLSSGIDSIRGTLITPRSWKRIVETSATRARSWGASTDGTHTWAGNSVSIESRRHQSAIMAATTGDKPPAKELDRNSFSRKITLKALQLPKQLCHRYVRLLKR